jgi:zinc protease
VPVNRLAEFYKKFYQPDNAVLVITGRIDDTKTLEMVAQSMGKLPRPARVLDQTYTVEPPQDGERFVSLRRVGQGQNVMVAYHAVAAAHPDAAVLQVLAGVMNGGGGGRGGRGGGGAQEGRLAKALVDTRLAESANMGFQLQHDPGLIVVSASLNQDQSLDAARDAIYNALDDVVKNPPTTEEINRVATQLARGLENSLSNAQSMATGALNSSIAQGDWRLMFIQHDRLQDVNPADVVRVAQAYLKPSNRTVGYYKPDPNPDRTVVPATPNLAETFRNYSSKVAVVRGESFDPTIENIQGRVVRSKLPNGMKVAVLAKKTANNMVSATVELRFGDATTLSGQREAASLAGALLMAGTKSHTRTQIQEELRKLNAQVNVGGGGGGGGRGGRGAGPGGGLSSATASISAPAENFFPALRLAVEMLKEPAYPQDDFDRFKTQRLKALEQTPTEPTQLANERLTRHLSPFVKTDAQYVPTREEQLQEMQLVTLADARKFHSDFYGANHGIVAVVGPVDPAAVQKEAATLLGGWNTAKGYKPLVAPFKKAAPINEKIEAPDKANAVFLAGQRFQLGQNDPDYPAIVLASYMFGETITSRIADRIRNREGLSYGANARMIVPAEGDSAMLTGTVSLNPAVGPKVEASFLDELKKVYESGFTAAEVAAAKKAYLDSRMVGRSTDGALLNLLVAHEQLDRPFKWDADLEARIQALTVAEINAAFRKHIDPAALSVVKAGDFKTAGAYTTTKNPQ